MLSVAVRFRKVCNKNERHLLGGSAVHCMPCTLGIRERKEVHNTVPSLIPTVKAYCARNNRNSVRCWPKPSDCLLRLQKARGGRLMSKVQVGHIGRRDVPGALGLFLLGYYSTIELCSRELDRCLTFGIRYVSLL